MDLDARLRAHAELTERLKSLSDDQLASVGAEVPVTWTAWAGHRRGVVGEYTIFMKRIPLTERELARPGSTRNVFDLPDYYNYGVGSAGFGAYREHQAHQVASELVLSGATPGFPLLHHHRVIPRLEVPPPFPIEHGRYLAMWNNSTAVAEYMTARLLATHEPWLVAEHIPHSVLRWHPENLDRTPDLLRELRQAAAALNDAGVLHFDASCGNAITDGERFYLCDFGLALSSHFELSGRERDFHRAHGNYDQAELKGPAPDYEAV